MQANLKVTAICLALAVPANTLAAPIDVSAAIWDSGVDLSASTIAVKRMSDGQVWISNPDRAEKPFIPASTSKIPHTFIALETDIASPETVFAWDGKTRSMAAWNADHTLKSAFQKSAVWVFQDIAMHAGHSQMASWIGKLDYGNKDIGNAANLTTYWLKGPLKISAMEQIDFLERLALNQLPLSSETLAQGKDIMQADTGAGWTLYAKTGWGLRGDDPDIGWYVGWVEQQAPSVEIYVFAFNLDIRRRSDGRKREAAARRVLVEVGALPQSASQ